MFTDASGTIRSINIVNGYGGYRVENPSSAEALYIYLVESNGKQIANLRANANAGNSYNGKKVNDLQAKRELLNNQFNMVMYEDALQKAMALTADYEGTNFTGVEGNFDGMGITMGIWGWNMGTGTLQPLFNDMNTNYSAVLQSVMGNRYGNFVQMLGMSQVNQMNWAVNADATWFSLLGNLASTPEFQAIQVNHSANYVNNAVSIFNNCGLTTERGLALSFDIAVQNGSAAASVASVQTLGSEGAKLTMMAQANAQRARAAYQNDVLTRKMTIVNGTGTVHGAIYNMSSQYGLDDRHVVGVPR